jgi:hypothetical protein
MGHLLEELASTTVRASGAIGRGVLMMPGVVGL